MSENALLIMASNCRDDDGWTTIYSRSKDADTTDSDHDTIEECDFDEGIVEMQIQEKLGGLIERGTTSSVLELISLCNHPKQVLCWENENSDGLPPLHFAVDQNKLDICQVLIYAGSSVNQQAGYDFKAPLHIAMEPNIGIQISNLLLASGAKVDIVDEMHCTPFQLLFMEPGPELQFQFDKFQLLLHNGACVNTRSAYGGMPLHGAAKTFHSDKCEEQHDNAQVPMCVVVSKILLSHGADVNSSTDGCLRTPLHFAAGDGCDEVLELFLEAGSYPDIKDINGNSGLHYLAMHTTPHNPDRYQNKEKYIQRRLSCIELLCTYNVNMNARNNMGNTPMHMLLEMPSAVTQPILQQFILRNAEVNTQNTRMETPLHLLATEKFIEPHHSLMHEIKKEILEIMIANNADLELRDINGRSILHAAVLRSDHDITELLLQNGVQVNAQDTFGRSCLHYVELNLINNTLRDILIQNGASENVKDQYGKTPSDYKCISNKMSLPQENDIPQDVDIGRFICWISTNDEEDKGLMSSKATDNGENITCAQQAKANIYSDHMEEDNGVDDKLQKLLLCMLTPINMTLDVTEHVQTLRNQLGDIDIFCQKILRKPEIGVSLMSQETDKMVNEVAILMSQIAKEVKLYDNRIEFTPVLSGSMSEKTKVGKVDEFDYLLYLDWLKDQCEIHDAADTIPGFVYIKAKPHLTQDEMENIFQQSDRHLVSNSLGPYLYRAVQHVLGYKRVWESLQFYWQRGPLPNEEGSGICCLELTWAGQYDLGLQVSIDLAPVIHLKDWWPKSVRLSSVLLSDPVKSYGSLIVICKPAPEEPLEHGHETYQRLSYSHVETRIFQKLPQYIKDSYMLAKVLISKYVWSILEIQSTTTKLHITSYMLKISLFHHCDEIFPSMLLTDGVGFESDIKAVRNTTRAIFTFLEKCIKRKKLPAYLLPPQNILQYHSTMSIQDREACLILKSLLE